MRISLTSSVLILALAAVFGWHQHQQLVTAREIHRKLTAEAARFGMSIDSASSDARVRLTKRGERGNKDAEARLAAKDFITFAMEMEAAQKNGVPPDEAAQKRIMAFVTRMMSLDAAQLKVLIAEVRAAPDLKDETRQGLIGFSIMTLANDHPQTALTLLMESSTDSSGLFKTDGMGMQVISSSLARWAKDDPMGALDWVKTNARKFPDSLMNNTKRGMISGAAANDPKLAFKLIGELGLQQDAVGSIVGVAKTPEERTATLAAWRAHLAALPDGEARDQASKSGVHSLALGAAKDGFEAGSQWIASAGFTPEQLAGLAGGGFSQHVKIEDTGKWIEWMGENLPEGKSDDDIRQMVRHWTTDDYQAAGKWLASTPGSAAKNISIRSYAETVANYEPQTAGQWAMTLPPGKDRDETLKHIYHAWPGTDDAAKAAAEAFAKQHGIK